MTTNCPGCSGSLVPLENESRLGKCSRCGGLVSIEAMPLRLLYKYVRLDVDMVDGPMDGTRYFDLDYTTGREPTKVQRTHGWFDPKTGRVLQFG